MTMKKLIALSLLAVMLFTLTACTSGTQTAAPQTTATPVTGFSPLLDTKAELSLNVVGEYGNFEALEQVIQDFQKYYPNVSITYEQITDFNAGLPIRFASGESIDLFYLNTMNFQTAFQGAISEYAVDLNTIQGMDLSALSDKVLEAGQADGKQILLPMYDQTYGLIANVTLLKKYGLSVPTTHDELIAACDKLLAEGITPLYGAQVLRRSLFESDCVYHLTHAENCDELCEAMNRGVLDASIVEDALAAYQDMEAKGYFNAEADTLKDSYNAAILRFFEGDIPFLVGTSDTISGCRKREAKSEAFTASPFEYTYFLPSMVENDEPKLLLVSMFFGVYDKSEHQDYANEFIRFMATRDELVTMATVKGMPSAIENTGDSRFTYVESLTDAQKLYAVDAPCGVNALSALNGALTKLSEGSVEAIQAEYTERLK